MAHTNIPAALAIGVVMVSSAAGQTCRPAPFPMGSISARVEPILLQDRGDPIFEPRCWAPAGDGTGRVFFLEQIGRVHIYQTGAVLQQPVLDVSDRMYYAQQRGLLALVLHPGFADVSSPGHQKLYTWSCEPRNSAPPDYALLSGPITHQLVLTEWTMSASNPNSADPGLEREVFRADFGAPSHSGGSPVFGPDGYMYFSMGAPANRPLSGQEHDHPDGSILRIDPLDPLLTPASLDPISANGKYRIARDNPFVGVAGHAPEIYAWGLRHPWRMAFDPLTGVLIAGDVGDALYEEVNIILRGGNYGWPYYEGDCPGLYPPPNPAPEFVKPIIVWHHDEGRAVVGTHVYRGSAIPELYGRLLAVDMTKYRGGFFSGPGRIFHAAVYDANGALLPRNEIVVEELQIGEGGEGLPMAPVDVAIDADGEIILLGVVTPWQGGSVYRLEPLVKACYADCDQTTGPGVLDIFDFLCFANAFAAGDPYACDCDVSTGPGVCDIFDFLCFGGAFAAGCP